MKIFTSAGAVAGLLCLSTALPAATCDEPPGFDHLYNAGWGNSLENTRFQAQSGINRGNVGRLQLQWVFALDESQAPHSYPVVTEDSLLIGTTSGNLYALDRATGCVRWSYAAAEQIRSGVSHGTVRDEKTGNERHLLFFGTFDGNVFAVDGVTGELAWKTDVKDHPYAMVTGTPTFYDGRLFVPISSGEVALAMNPFYGCCHFRQ